MRRYKVNLLFFLILFAPASLFADSRLFSNLIFSPTPGVKIAISLEKGYLRARNGDQVKILERNLKVPHYAVDLWVEDFNFDGHDDIAVTTRTTRNMIDQFYTIYTWDSEKQELGPLAFSGELGDIEIEPKRKELRSSYKEKNFWVEDTYRFIDNFPFLYSRSKLIAIDIWHTTIFDPLGKIMRTVVSADGRTEQPPQPVVVTIGADDAPLFSEPRPATQTGKSLQKGDIVTIEDFQVGAHDQLQWVFVRARVKEPELSGWTLLSYLDLG